MATITRQSDLTPPLGKPGGPEHIEDRIKKRVTDPHLEQRLVDEVEHGVDLSNDEAAKVYPMGTEPGVGPIRQFLLGPHSEYRMDLRSITVDQVREALKTFIKEYQDGKSRKSWESEQWTKALKSGEKIEYEAPNHLFVVFTAPRPDQVKIVTTYWKGRPDPKPHKRAHDKCDLGTHWNSNTNKCERAGIILRHHQNVATRHSEKANSASNKANGAGSSENHNHASKAHEEAAKHHETARDHAHAKGFHGLADSHQDAVNTHRMKAKIHHDAPNVGHYAGYRAPDGDLTGYKTFVENSDGTQKKDPKPGENEEKHQVLPSPEHSRQMDLGPAAINGPPSSGGSPDGRSLHKDKVRTPGTPGSEPPLDNPSMNSPQSRKPNMQASNERLADRWLQGQDEMVRREGPKSEPGQHFDRAGPPQGWEHEPSQSGFDTDIAVPDNPGSAKVIPDNKDFVNHKNKVGQKMATRISEILDGCEPSLRARAQGLPVKLTRVSPTHMWTFNVKGKTGTYRVRLKAFPKGNATSITKMDVKMSCTCPYWRWQGPEHHASSEDYQYGPLAGTASVPVIKDPNGVHHACKHMIAVLNDAMNISIPKSRRVQKLGALLTGIAAERVAGRYYRAMLRRTA